MEILIRLVLGFFGMSVHCLKNFDSLRKDAKALKAGFSFKEYLEADFISISMSLIAVLSWPFLFDEFATKYAYLEVWVRTSFFGVGLLGSYGINAFLGRGRNAIRSIAKEKTEALESIQAFADAPDGDPIPPNGPKG